MIGKAAATGEREQLLDRRLEVAVPVQCEIEALFLHRDEAKPVAVGSGLDGKPRIRIAAADGERQIVFTARRVFGKAQGVTRDLRLRQ